MQFAGVVFGALRGAELRPQPQRGRGGTGQRSSAVLWRRLVARRRGSALIVVFQQLPLDGRPLIAASRTSASGLCVLFTPGNLMCEA